MKTLRLIPAVLWGLLLASICSNAGAQPSPSRPPGPITNLLQLIQLLNSNERAVRDIQLEAIVCDASDPALGVVVLQDATATELFQFSNGTTNLSAGDMIKINRRACLLRRRESGVQISAAPVVDNNGIHPRSTTGTGIALKKGRHSVTVEWFNRGHPPSLEVRWQRPGLPAEEISSTNLFYSAIAGGPAQSVERPGLFAEYYEGSWDHVPNFELLVPVRSTVVTNFNVDIRTRDESVGIRFCGLVDVPSDGTYQFTTRSADGSLLFIDDVSVPITVVGKRSAPQPVPVTINEPLSTPTEQQWVTVEGRVKSITPVGRGLELELASEHNFLRVGILASLGWTNLLNARIRVAGVERCLFGPGGEAMLGEVFAANAHSIEIVGATDKRPEPSVLLKVEQVQSLSLEDARRHLPIQLKGVVTSRARPVDAWLSVQDGSRGIFVRVRNISGDFPASGDFYEITGTSDVGDFAPVVVADRLTRLGSGEFPQPLRPTWDELNNGSADVQWVEVKGLVTEVHSNLFSMLMPSGRMDVQIEGPDLSNLKSFERAVVSIRGVLFAQWNAAHEVRVGNILMRNASITVDIPAPVDRFDAVLKTPRELLLFDAQATAFRRVRVRGQIIYTDAGQAFLQDESDGIRLLPAEKSYFKPGDLVEAVGYPDIRRADMLLHQAVIRKIGEARLLAPKKLAKSFADVEGLDSTRVRIEGYLLGSHLEQYHTVLEMQSGTHLYLARLAGFQGGVPRQGSDLALEGVFVSKGGSSADQVGADAFELLLNSSNDITVLSEPSWWTLPRLLILVGILMAILLGSALWITQLRRVVEQRTTELQREIHERERVEQQRALEIERSRIARDLHDDLGASLTEIAVLAGKGRRVTGIEEGIVTLLRTIGSKARELVGALDIIVWAVDPKDNSLQSVADYLCDFTDEYLSPSGIACRFDVPVALPNVVLEGRCRHDLFLAVKESLNNIVRHAGATEVEFRISVANNLLEIAIVDNGKGFDVTLPRSGKGLQSLPARLAQMGGSHEIQSRAGKGTVVTIKLNLATQKTSRNGMVL